MDREIPKEVRDKERKKKFIKIWCNRCGGSGMYSCIDFVYAK